jgi:hypothetical protein
LSYRSPWAFIPGIEYYTELFGFNPLNILVLIHHAKTQSSTARPPSAVKAAFDRAVAPPAAPPVEEDESAVDEASSPPLSVALADSVAELSATATVEDELTTPVLLPCSSVTVLTTSTVELPVTLA